MLDCGVAGFEICCFVDCGLNKGVCIVCFGLVCSVSTLFACEYD